MAIKIEDFTYGVARSDGQEEGELEVTFIVTSDQEAISFLGALSAFVLSYSTGTAPTLVDSGVNALVESEEQARLERGMTALHQKAAEPAPVKTSKRASTKPVAPAPEPAPAAIVQPQAAPVQTTVSPAATPAPAVAPAPVAVMAGDFGQPKLSAAPVPGIPKDAPAELVAAKSFREVIVFFLGHGVSQGEVIEAACAQYRAQVPLIDKLMQPQDDPEAVLSARIKRALVVLQKPA